MESQIKNQLLSSTGRRFFHACWIFLSLNIIFSVLDDAQSRFGVAAACIADNCLSCDTNSPLCKVCNSPFTLNEYGFCEASSVCSLNQFYQLDSQNCKDSCPSGFIENSVLNYCDQVNTCSNNNYIGNKYLQSEFNAPIFFDTTQQIYIQCTSASQINIYDSTNLQFQASVLTEMQIVSKSVYDSLTQNIVVTNIQGEIEIWNILSTNLVFKTKVINYDGTNILYINGIQKFFYLDTNKYLTVIDDFTIGPKKLQYQLVNTDFVTSYVTSNQSLVFSGTQLELLHISLVDYSQIYYHPYDPTLSITGSLMYRTTFFNTFYMLYRLQPLGYSILYYTQTSTWVNSTTVSPTSIGEFLGNLYQKYNSTHILFYDVDATTGNLLQKGVYYPLVQNYFIPYDSNTKGIGLTISQTASVVGPHIKFDLNYSATAKFTDQMITNIVTFTQQITNFILIDDINRRLIVRGLDGNIIVINIDTLKVIFSIKQFQQPPLSATETAFMISNRVDPINQSNLYTTTVNSIQNINLFNNKRRMKSVVVPSNYWNLQATKDYIISQFTSGNNLFVFKQSNMQRLQTIAVSASLQDNIVKCVNPYIMVSGTNDFITVCKNKIVYWPFASTTTGYSTPTATYALKNTAFYQAKEMLNHIIVCYAADCYQHLKTSITAGATFVTGITGGVNSINARSDQTFFTILTNSSNVLFYSYPAFLSQGLFTLPSPCALLIGAGFIEGNRAVYACRPDLVSISINFFILTLSAGPAVTCNTLKIDRLITILTIFDSQTIFSLYASGAKLYFFMYSFQLNFSQIVEKVSNVVTFGSTLPNPYYDTTLRRVFFTYNNMIYANTRFVGEYQIWSYSYRNHYYDVLDSANTNQILKFKKCFYRSYVIGVVRQDNIYVSDNLHNLEFRKIVTGVTDIYVDSTINSLIYVTNTNEIILHNYVTDVQTYKLTHATTFTEIVTFTTPTYANTFFVYNKANLDISLCQYTQIDIKCQTLTLVNPNAAVQTGIIINSMSCYSNVGLVFDSSNFAYYLSIDPTKTSNQIFIINGYETNKNVLKLIPALSLLVVQNISQKDGYISNSNGQILSTLKFPTEILDIISVQNDYFLVMQKYIYRVTKSFTTVFSITTTMVVKKAIYYSSKNILLILSTQRSYYNYISFYDISTQLQLQSIQVGINPLEDIIYLPEEDIFVVYSVYGQIFRIDLNKADQEDYIVNVLEPDTGSATNNYFSKIYFNRIVNKMFFANQNTVHKWNYSPFIGERLNFRRVRYLQFGAVSNIANPEIIYYSDIQSFLWAFQNGQQLLIGQAVSEVQEAYSSPDYLAVFCFTNIYIFQISDFTNSLLINISFTTTTIQYSMKFKQQIFAYITSDFDFYLFDLSTKQYNNAPVKIATLTAQIQDFILISDDTVIISLLGVVPVKYKLGDTAFTPLTGLPICKSFIGSKDLTSLNTLIIIEERNIISLNLSTLALNTSINFPEYDSARYIESFAFDETQNLLYYHMANENYVSIIPYSLDKPSIKFVGSCDMYQVKFLIESEYVAIYCQFQVNFHKRDAQLTYLYSFRQPTIVKSMVNLIILNDVYLITTQQSVINIFSMSALSGDTRTFTLYRTIQSTRSQIFQCQINTEGNIKIQGVGLEGYFNNLIVMANQCENTFDSIKNKLNLKNQLNQVSISDENIQKYYYFSIQLDSHTPYTSLPFIDELKFTQNNALIKFIPQTTGQPLTLNNDLFANLVIVDLVMNDFTFMIPDNSNNIQFNEATSTIIFKVISINQDLNNVSFKFKNLKRVIIDQLTITDITITDSIVFYVENVEQFSISNMNVINTNFVRSQLIYVLDSKQISISTLQLQSVRIFEYAKKMIINICNTDQVSIGDFFFRDVTGTDVATTTDRSTSEEVFERDITYLSIQSNHIIYLQKVKNILFKKGDCQSLKKLSMLKIEDFYTDGSILQTLETSFIDIQGVNFKSNIAMFSVVAIKGSNINIEGVTAQYNFCSDCNGGVFFIYESKVFTVKDSSFEQNEAIHGGSVSLQQCVLHTNNVINSSFTTNVAKGNGGAIYLDNCDLDMKKAIFTSNKALIGGAIRYKDYVPIFIQGISDILNSITFKDNVGEIFGNNYGSYLGRISVEPIDNSMITGDYISANNTFQTMEVNNFSSGDSIILSVKIQDEESDLISFNPANLSVSKKIPNSIRSEFLKIILNMVSNGDQILIEGANFATFQQFEQSSQLFIFPSNRLIAQPKKTGTLFIQTNVDFEIPSYLLDKFISDSAKSNLIKGRRLQTTPMKQTVNKNQFSITIDFKFRDCQVGEIYQNISDTKTSCYRCPTGSYSLVVPDYFQKQECTQCNQITTQECGNNTIILREGYWRIDYQSDIIVECINRPENCKDNGETRGYCEKGLIGPLCEQCDILGQVWGEPFSQTLDYQCAPCTNYFDTYVRWVFIFLGVNVYILGTLWVFFQIYTQKSIVYYLRLANMICFGNSARRDQSSTYLKFLINYAQLQSNINQFKYDIFVLSIPSMFGQPVSQLNTATDCQIVSYQNKLLVKTAAMLCLPVLFYIWICFGFLIKSIFSKRNDDYWVLARMKLFTLFLFSFTVFQPNIVSFLIQSLSCRVIGDKKYVSSDITMECYNDEHVYVVLIAIIGIFLWVVMVPAYIYIKLRKIKHIEWITNQYCYGFLYIEFKKENIYWELIRLYLKLFVVIFVNLLRENLVTQFTCLSLTLFAYYHLVHWRAPYETHHMNKIDKQIIISLSFQVIMNAVLKDTDQESTSHIVVMMITVIVNIATFSFLIITIMLQKIQFIRQNIIKFKYKLQQIPCFKNFAFLQVATEIETNFRRFKLWRILSLNLQFAIAACQRVKYQQLRENYQLRSQTMKNQIQAGKSSDAQQVKESMGFDMMFRELDSITVKRGNSSLPTQVRGQPKQLTNAKQLYNGDQLNLTLEAEQSQSPQYGPSHMLHDRITEDKSNMDVLNSVMGKDSKYVGQNSIPYNPNFAQKQLLKVSVSYSNSPLQNSCNSLTAQNNNVVDKASPFKLLHNGVLGKHLLSHRSNADNSPLVDTDNLLPSNQISGVSLNHIGSTAAMSNNLIGNSSTSHLPMTKALLAANYSKTQDFDEFKSPPSISHNVSAIYNPKIQEREEDESKAKFEAVGLKTFNSQINPKIISDENLSQPPNLQRNLTSSDSSNEQIDGNKEDDDDIYSNRKSMEGSIPYDNIKIQESPHSNLPSQLDRYSYPTDYLMKLSKR